MILYFTGSGNSKFAADFLADKLDDETVSLNNIIKNNLPAVFKSEKPFIVVAPIYAWRFPRIIADLLYKAEFNGTKKIYFVPTMGSCCGKTDVYCEKLCKAKGLEFMGLCGVPMPDNYIIAGLLPDEEGIKKKIEAAKPLIDEIAGIIAASGKLEKHDITPHPALKSDFINFFFRHFATSSKGYVVSDSCIGCSKCEGLCPTNNITMKDGKPSFGNSCIACYACIHRCPKAAIDIKGKTENVSRYVCPEYKK